MSCSSSSIIFLVWVLVIVSGIYGSKQTKLEGIARGQDLFTNSHKSLATCAVTTIYTCMRFYNLGYTRLVSKCCCISRRKRRKVIIGEVCVFFASSPWSTSVVVLSLLWQRWRVTLVHSCSQPSPSSGHMSHNPCRAFLSPGRREKVCVCSILRCSSLFPRPRPAFRHLQYGSFLLAHGESLGTRLTSTL